MVSSQLPRHAAFEEIAQRPTQAPVRCQRWEWPELPGEAEVAVRVRVHAPFIIGLLFATVSCGGSDSTPSATDAPSAADEPSATETAAPADEAPADEAAAPTTPPAPSGSNAAAGTGTITIGDLSHELTIIRCVAIAGAIGADAVSVSEPDNVDVNFSFSPENWQDRPASEGWTETGTARLDVDDPYQQWESGPSLLEVFNLPNPNDSCEDRDSAAVSPQSFTLFNSDLMTDRSIAMAIRVETEAQTANQQLNRAFELTLGRAPTIQESDRLQKYLTEMRAYHARVKPKPVTYPTKVTKSLVEELSGKTFEYDEALPAFENYTPDKKAADVSVETRALADVCLLLFNSHEFLYLQ